MNKDEIGKAINPSYPYVYAPTTESTKLIFKDGKEMIGFFQKISTSDNLEKENKYTFIEYNKAQYFRLNNNDESVATIVKGDDLSDVEYPSSPTLERLRKMKKILSENETINWVDYKEKWKVAVTTLQNTITEKWLVDYKNDGLMEFSLLPVKKNEPNIGEYLTMILEIHLINEQVLILEPVSAITSEYQGSLNFYMRGNVYKSVSIYRNKESQWILAKSYNIQDHLPLNKVNLEILIDKWVQ